MRLPRQLAVLVLTALVVLVGASGATAITNGQPDGDNHPYVGLMVAHDEDGVPLWRCSGSLIAPDVFLTAGHCVEEPAAHVEIWFDEGPVLTDPEFLAAVVAADPDDPVSCDDSPDFDGYPCEGDVGGDPVPHPDFCIPCGPGLINFAVRDVGVVDLDEDPVPTSVVGEYADLPEPNQVDDLANKTPIDFVGYGVQFQAQIPGNVLPQPPPFFRWTGPRQRMWAPSELIAGNFRGSDEFLRISMNASKGSGGTCFGDSGGPDLLGGTDTVLGVNSFVTNVNCSGVGYAQRVDVPDILEWIEGFIG